jgi:hypothetical protein
MGGPTGKSDARYDCYRFGSVAFLLRYVTLEQLQLGLAEQIGDNVSVRKHRCLGTIRREKNWINEEQIKAIVAEMETIGK